MHTERTTSDDDSGNDLQIVTRRNILATAGVASAGLFGLGVVATDDVAAADAEINGLAIDNAAHSGENPAVIPRVEATIDFAFDVSDAVTEVALELQAKPEPEGETAYEVIDTDSIVTSTSQAESSKTLSGRLTSIRHWDESDYDPAAGEQTSESVEVAVWMAVIGPSGILETVRSSDSTTVTVENTANAYELSIGGNAEVTFVEA